MLAVGAQRLVVAGLAAFLVQLGETHLEDVFPGIEGDSAHRGIGGQFFQGGLADVFPVSVFRRQAAGDVVAQRRPGRIAFADFRLQGGVDFILVRLFIGHRTAAEQVPEDVFPVVADEFLQGATQIGIEVAVEFGMVALGKGVPFRAHILPAFFGGFAAENAHPSVGHDGLVKSLDQGLEFGPEGVLELPVAALLGVDVLLAGIVEIGREMPSHRFVADVPEDFGFLLGAVGIVHLFVFRPAGGENVSVRIHKLFFGNGILALGEEQEGSCGQEQGGEGEESRFHFFSK